MAYTPGPWSADGTDIIADSNMCIALVLRPRIDDDGDLLPNSTVYANTRLIVSAPDLIARLEEVTDWLGHLSNCKASDQCVDSARRLLRHITGGD